MNHKDVLFAQRVGRGVKFLITGAIHYATLALVGTAVAFHESMAAAQIQSQGLAFNDGASPAGMQSGQSPQASLVIHYNAKFTQNLKGKTPAQRVVSRRPMPLNAGQKYRDFMYQQLGTSLTNAVEGTVGTPLQVGVSSQDFTVGQWADYVNFSDFVLATTIDPMVENVEKELAYRLGRIIQQLTLAQMDAGRSIDTRVSTQDAPSATTLMSRGTGTAASGGLRATDVNPLADMSRFGGLIHPSFVTDMLIDTSVNSVVDIMKHTPEGQMALKELPAPAGGEEVDVISFGGVTWLESTQLTKTANFAGSTKTAIRTYVVGEDGVLAIRLERPDRTSIGDGKFQNLKLWRGKYAMGSSFDPAGQIGGGTSYNVTGTWGLPPDTTLRFRAYDYVPQNT